MTTGVAAPHGPSAADDPSAAEGPSTPDGASAPHGTPSAADVPGWNRVSTTALVHTAQAVAAAALHARPVDVRARVIDDGQGALAVSVTAPLPLPRLGSLRNGDAGASTGVGAGSGSGSEETVVQAAHRARRVIADGVSRITGRSVARVDVEYASSVIEQSRRVR